MNRTPLRSRWAYISCCLLLGSLLLTPGRPCRAHEDNNTHARLTIASFLFLDQTYPEDGALFSPNARGLARQGSIDEDNDPLYFNHFFNPKTGGTIDTSGFPFYYDEVTAPERARVLWSSAIQQYRSGQTNSAFSNLGHVIHLLQDMTSPAHVHLDIHGDPRSGAACDQDTDDFENWGYCDNFSQHKKILEYVEYTDVVNSRILPQLSTGLERIFSNRPQVVTPLSGENYGYAYVRDVADRVYDFTTFDVFLKDTGSLFEYDKGAGDLGQMFDVWEYGGASGGWYFEDSWSQGECGGNRDQAWWLMDYECSARDCPDQSNCTIDEGGVYIENVGGGDGGGSAIPDILIPRYYLPLGNGPWFQRRYNTPSDGRNTANVTMLRIYGDVLYAAAVAYGAGLLGAFLDEAIMPKPVSALPTQFTKTSAQWNGKVNPNGVSAYAWFEWYEGGTPGVWSSSQVQSIGAGQSPTDVSVTITNLDPSHLYFYRIVSSNQFGVRYGTTQTFRIPTLVVQPPVTYNFNSGVPPNTAIYGNASVTANGVLELNASAANQSGAFLSADLAPGRVVHGFAASFKARLVSGTTPPADGFSFNWATDLPNGTYANGEEGAGSGLRVCFDSYDNGGGEAPAIDIWWGPTLVTRTNVSGSFLFQGENFFDVQIRLSTDGLLDLSYGSQMVFSRLPVTGYTPQMGARFGLGSRTGASYELHSLDDLTLELYVDATGNSPWITGVNLQAGGIMMHGAGMPGQNYSLETSSDLVTWTWRADALTDAYGVWQFTEPGIVTPRYRAYRLKAAPQFPSGLITWYRADGHYGDSFGANHGTPENDLGFSGGQRGQAFSFDGTKGMFIGGAAIPVPWTAAFWVKRHDAPLSGSTLLSDDVSELRLESGGIRFRRQVGFSQSGPGFDSNYAFNYTAPTDTWTHLAFVATTSSTLLYANGDLVGSQPAAVNLPLEYLGRRSLDTSQGRLVGELDEITLFRRALTPAEIQRLRNATRGP